MYWCFAKLSNRLAEIYFKKKKGKSKIFAHCYINKLEFKNKKEINQIDKDTKKFHLTYKNGKYSIL